MLLTPSTLVAEDLDRVSLHGGGRRAHASTTNRPASAPTVAASPPVSRSQGSKLQAAFGKRLLSPPAVPADLAAAGTGAPTASRRRLTLLRRGNGSPALAGGDATADAAAATDDDSGVEAYPAPSPLRRSVGGGVRVGGDDVPPQLVLPASQSSAIVPCVAASGPSGAAAMRTPPRAGERRRSTVALLRLLPVSGISQTAPQVRRCVSSYPNIYLGVIVQGVVDAVGLTVMQGRCCRGAVW